MCCVEVEIVTWHYLASATSILTSYAASAVVEEVLLCMHQVLPATTTNQHTGRPHSSLFRLAGDSKVTPLCVRSSGES